jgi:hypothetical protein
MLLASLVKLATPYSWQVPSSLVDDGLQLGPLHCCSCPTANHQAKTLLGILLKHLLQLETLQYYRHYSAELLGCLAGLRAFLKAETCKPRSPKLTC